MKDKAVIVEDLTFKYEEAEKWSLDSISFSLDYGEILGVLGPTGAGKSTLAMCLNGIVPSVISGDIQGKITVDQKDVSKTTVSEMSTSVGFVFQEPENQLSQMTIEEEVAFGLGNSGVPSHIMRERITEALKTVGLEGFEKRSPLELSGGQQQRLVIASVLALYPKILIMDEPTSMLDPKGKNEVYEVLNKIKQEKITGIIVDHEVERLADYCDKILILHEGKMVTFDTPKAVFSELDRLHEMKINGPQVTELTHRINEESSITVEQSCTLREAVEIFNNLDIVKEER